MDLYLETYELDLNFKFALINKRLVYRRSDAIVLLPDYVRTKSKRPRLLPFTITKK